MCKIILLNKKIKEIFDINITWNCEIPEDKNNIFTHLKPSYNQLNYNNFFFTFFIFIIITLIYLLKKIKY